jgi:hypothetical protein
LLEKQTSMGVSHARMLRLASAIAGDTSAARDFNARISWQDVEVRSLAQAADAYGKIAQQLGVPKEFLWRFIPGFDATDVQEMRDMVLDDDPLTSYLRDEFAQNLLPGTAEEMHKVEIEQAKAGIKAKKRPTENTNQFVQDASRANKAGRALPSQSPPFDHSPGTGQ